MRMNFEIKFRSIIGRNHQRAFLIKEIEKRDAELSEEYCEKRETCDKMTLIQDLMDTINPLIKE